MVQNTRKKKEQQTIEKRPSPPRLVARSRSDGRARDDGKASGGSVRSGGSGGRAGGRPPPPPFPPVLTGQASSLPSYLLDKPRPSPVRIPAPAASA
jgi:hypothetical protein